MKKKGKLLICFVLSGFLLLSFGPTCFADEPVTQELTLQQAVDRALDLSRTLKAAEIEKDKAQEQKENARKAVKYTPIGMVNPQIQAAYAALMQAELNYQMKSKDLSALQDDIKTKVLEKYCAVLSAQASYSAAQQRLKDAEWQYTASIAKLRVGMIAPANQVAIDAALEAAKSGKAGLLQSQESLNKAYVELNSLVGFSPETRALLVTEIPFEKLQVDSITADVNRAISNNTDVWKALQNVIIQRQDLRMDLQPYEIEKLEIEIAELSAAEAKHQLEEALTLLYHDIMTLESGIAAAEQGVAAAEQALATAKLRFDVGMATQGDVIGAQTDLETARETLKVLKYNHATALSAYRNLTGRDVLPGIAQEEDFQENVV